MKKEMNNRKQWKWYNQAKHYYNPILKEYNFFPKKGDGIAYLNYNKIFKLKIEYWTTL